MRLLFSVFVTALVATNAAYPITNPEDAGSLFRESFEKLTDVYSTSKPKSREEMILSSSTITSNCEEHDNDCSATAFKQIEDELEAAEDEPNQLIYSDNFDPKLMQYMEKVESALQEFNLDNVDDVVEEILCVKEEIENMDDVNAADKTAALSGLQIALESVQLWYKAYTNPNHPLYGIHYPSHYLTDSSEAESGVRKLKEIDVASISINDFQNGFNRAVETLSGGKESMLATFARSFLVCNQGGGGSGNWGYYHGYGHHHGHHYYGYGHGVTQHTHNTDGTITTVTTGHTHTGGTTTTVTTVSHTHAHGNSHAYTHTHGN